MIPTVEECIAEAQFLLADTDKRVFTDAVVLPAVKRAIRLLKAEMAKNQIPRMKRIVTYTLSAGATSLTPATVGIADFGELIEMEERAANSSDRYQRVYEVEKLPQRDPDSALLVFEWREDTFYFLGATGARQMRITYLDSGDAPTTGSIGIDGCLPYISAKAGAIVAPTKGYEERGAQLAVEAEVELSELIAPMIRKMQQTPLQPRAYTVRRTSSFPFAQPYIAAPPTEGALSNLIITGTQDGENVTFTLNGSPPAVQIFRNGQLLAEGTAYVRAGSTITFNPGYIPEAADVLSAWA